MDGSILAERAKFSDLLNMDHSDPIVQPSQLAVEYASPAATQAR